MIIIWTIVLDIWADYQSLSTSPVPYFNHINLFVDMSSWHGVVIDIRQITGLLCWNLFVFYAIKAGTVKNYKAL